MFGPVIGPRRQVSGRLGVIAQALKRGELVNALPGVRPVADTIYAVYPQTRHLSRKVRAVIDHLVDALGGEPLWENELN